MSTKPLFSCMNTALATPGFYEPTYVCQTGARSLLLVTRCSWLVVLRRSLFVSPCSWLVASRSLLVARAVVDLVLRSSSFPLVLHFSFVSILFHLPLVVRGPSLVARCLSFVPRFSLLLARSLVVRGSFLFARCSSLVARGSWLLVHVSVFVPRCS